MADITYVSRYNPTLKIWELGYWFGRIFYVLSRYPHI